MTSASHSVTDPLGNASGAVVLATLAAVVVTPFALAWWLHGRLRRWGNARGRVIALLLCLAYIALSASIAALTERSVVAAALDAVVTLAVAHLVVWSGIASLIGWAGRWAWQSMGAIQQMASHALPVILILLVFTFFSTEAWQIADAIGWPRQFLLSAVIALIAVLAMAPVGRNEVTTAHRDLTVEQVRALLEGTPLARARVRAVSGGELSGSGRLNVLAVLILAHLIQAAMFAVVVTALLVTIGRIAIGDAVVQAWLDKPRLPYRVLGEDLPLDHQTLHTAFLLGVIGALSFVLTSLTDTSYRAIFFDPLVERVKVAVAAHRALAVEDAPDGGPQKTASAQGETEFDPRAAGEG